MSGALVNGSVETAGRSGAGDGPAPAAERGSPAAAGDEARRPGTGAPDPTVHFTVEENPPWHMSILLGFQVRTH